MSLPNEHRIQTKKLVKALPKSAVAKWLLEEGFFPEQYVLPPCFHIEKFTFKKNPYYDFSKKKLTIPISEIAEISFPKSVLTLREFGVMNHKLYHDAVWQIINNWDDALKILFDSQNKIYAYSFPIPLNKNKLGHLGSLRAGRMIYEFIEMAENDIVSEAHKFSISIKSDIKNFYPSLYTHSIAWAINGKVDARKDRYTRNLLGNRLDRLFQNANDGCTNGIPIGPAISDLVTEIVLAAIDKKISLELKSKDIDFVAVRFKDDYRFLCHSKSDAKEILSTLQRKLKEYNLSISEEKSIVGDLPEGLFRLWTSEYQPYSLRNKWKVPYKKFEMTFRKVLQLNEAFPGTGVIDKFLSELISKKYNLKLELKSKEIYKVFSLLMLLREKRPKALPQILAIIELMMYKYPLQFVAYDKIFESLNSIAKRQSKNQESNLYELIWLIYFLKSWSRLTIRITSKVTSSLLQSIKSNKQKFETGTAYFNAYRKIKPKGNNMLLAKHLDVFPKDD